MYFHEMTDISMVQPTTPQPPGAPRHTPPAPGGLPMAAPNRTRVRFGAAMGSLGWAMAPGGVSIYFMYFMELPNSLFL